MQYQQPPHLSLVRRAQRRLTGPQWASLAPHSKTSSVQLPFSSLTSASELRAVQLHSLGGSQGDGPSSTASRKPPLCFSAAAVSQVGMPADTAARDQPSAVQRSEKGLIQQLSAWPQPASLIFLCAFVRVCVWLQRGSS